MSTLTATVLMSYIPGTASNKYFNEMSSTQVLTGTDEKTTVVPLAQTDDNDDIVASASQSGDSVDAAATRRSRQTKQVPLTKGEDDTATRRALQTKQAPLAKGEDDTDIDPTIILSQKMKELTELSWKSTSQKDQINNNVPSPGPTIPRTTYAQSKYVYNMQHRDRGKAVIINNINFQKITGMSKRGGSQRDADSLVVILDKLGFTVQAHTDLTVKKTRAVLNSISRQDHSNADCLLFAIMSHGEEGLLYCVDGTIPVEEVTTPFRGDKCPSLAGKPKIFFIQACRGQKLDSGVEIGTEEVDAAIYGYPGEKRQLIPSEADFWLAIHHPRLLLLA
ncbi:caspase-7-like [Amphiura filiformis]|uniref:caspase-7-like n=1 Tax=Amphiura filiformis TaxID=82378 RepID=UPI003B21626D